MDEDQLFEGKTVGHNPSEPNPQNNFNNNGQPSRAVNYNTNYNTNYDKNTRGRGCLIAAIVFLAAIIIIVIAIASSCVAMVGGAFNSVSLDDYSYAPNESYVEVIRVEGYIYDDSTGYTNSGYSHTTVLNRLIDLTDDSNNKGLILYFNSGGGGAYESDELYLALKDYKERTGRPIYAYYAQLAASGAVYASMAADQIYANRMSMTGSIGVVMSSYNISGLLEKLGIEEINITSGENKAMLSSGSEVTEEQLAILQSLIDESYEIFAGIVSEERGIALDKVMEIADGRLYSPKQALELGLIDGILGYDDFISTVLNTRALKNCVLYETPYPSIPLWNNLFFQTRAEGDSELVETILDSTQRSPLKFEVQ